MSAFPYEIPQEYIIKIMPILIIFIILVISWFFKRVLPKWVEDEMKNQIGGLTDSQLEALRELARDRASDLAIRKKSQILVLGAANDCPDFFRKMRESWSLRLEYTSLNTHFPPEDIAHWKAFDCLLIDNLSYPFLTEDGKHEGSITFKELETIGSHLQGTKLVLFYLGKERVKPPDNMGDSFLFANSYAQLTGNLLNALRYLDIVKS